MGKGTKGSLLHACQGKNLLWADYQACRTKLDQISRTGGGSGRDGRMVCCPSESGKLQAWQ